LLWPKIKNNLNQKVKIGLEIQQTLEKYGFVLFVGILVTTLGIEINIKINTTTNTYYD
jgi:hypothetical protein